MAISPATSDSLIGKYAPYVPSCLPILSMKSCHAASSPMTLYMRTIHVYPPPPPDLGSCMPILPFHFGSSRSLHALGASPVFTRVVFQAKDTVLSSKRTHRPSAGWLFGG